MKRFLKGFLTAALFFAATGAFADSWHLCLGSYGKRESAVELKNILDRKNIETFVSKFNKNENETYYRVLYCERFDSPEQGMEKKRQLESDENFRKLGIRNIWCAKIPDPRPRPEMRRNPEEREVLVERIIEIIKEVPVEVEKPVTVEKVVELIKEVPVECPQVEPETTPDAVEVPVDEERPALEEAAEPAAEFVEPEVHDTPVSETAE